jgi:hypothetical protein
LATDVSEQRGGSVFKGRISDEEHRNSENGNRTGVSENWDWLARLPAFFFGYLNPQQGNTTLSINGRRNIPAEQSVKLHTYTSLRTSITSPMCHVTTHCQDQILDSFVKLQADKGSLALHVLHGKNNGSRASCHFHKSEVKCNIQMKQRNA